MGSSPLTPSIGKNEDLLDRYTPKKKIADLRYGECTLLQAKSNKDLVIMKEITINTYKDYVETLSKWESRLKLEHPNILQLIGLCTKEESQFCSKFYKIFLLFEYIKTDLDEEIQAKRRKNTVFTKDELTFLIFCCVNSLFYYQKCNLAHGDVRSASVFVSQNGVYKMVEHSFFNGPSSFLQVQYNLERAHTGVYLSPQLMGSLGKARPSHNPGKSDVFALGMVILEVGLLEKLDDCYDFKESKILWSILETKLELFKKRFPGWITSVVTGMLKESEDERMDFGEILGSLKISEELKKDGRFMEVTQKKLEILKNPLKITLVKMSNLLDGRAKNEISMASVLEDLTNENMGLKRPEEETEKSFFSESRSFLNRTTKQDIDDEYLRLILIKEGRLEDSAENKRKNSNFIKNSGVMVSDLSRKGNQVLPSFSQVLPHTSTSKHTVTETYNNGSKYVGEKENSKRHGKGIFYYAEGGYYTGEWKDNTMHGYGKLYYPSGQIAYAGYWFQDKFHGYGELHNEEDNLPPYSPNNKVLGFDGMLESSNNGIDYRNFEEVGEKWRKYEGNFKNDCKDGYGVLEFWNGEKWAGNFRGDKAEGEGNFYGRNGEIVSGVWRGNRFYGR